jgi:choline dehydrogenase
MADRVSHLSAHLTASASQPASPAPSLQLFHPANCALKAEYDYVIVGAGSAGCALAATLARKLPEATVLLIEAGGTNQLFKVRSPFVTCPGLQNTELDWAYRTAPQPLQQNRRSFWPRGKMLGGSSSINYMLAVRADPAGYDEWAAKHGCEGWDFQTLQPYFAAMEDYAGSAHLPHRGKQGPIKVRDNRDDATIITRPVCDAFVQGCAACGVPETPDYNAPHSHEGAAHAQVSIGPDGYRCDTATAFLFGERGAMGTCPNLSVLCNAQVAALDVTGEGACRGAAFVGGGSVRARETILCAGAVGSAHILLLSGIGPAAHLQSKGVAVKKHLPGVGQNMKDHLFTGLSFTFRPEATHGFLDLTHKWTVASSLARHLVWGNGVFSTSWIQAMAFKKSSHCAAAAASAARSPPPSDIQIHFMPFTSQDEEGGKRNLGFDREKYVMAPAGTGPVRGVTFLPSLLQPKSVGYLELKSSDPTEHPLIEPRYLSSERDIDVLVEAWEFCVQVAKSAPMQRFLLPDETADPTIPFPVGSKEYIRAKVKRDVVTIYHHTSTCKMGPQTDPLAVLNPRDLRVWGVRGLRVADCASMPDIPAGNTNLPAVALALRAADLIANVHV